MKKSIKVDQKKRRGRPATGRGLMVSSRIPEATVTTIDAWADQNETTRSDAIRRLVELGLTVRTRPKQSAPARAERAKDLAGKVIDSFSTDGADVEETASRKRRLLKGPEEFREARVDRTRK
jgi:hypothetical protein